MADDRPIDTQDETPDWLDARFTSVEAQAKAYADARREMQQQQQESQRLAAENQQWQEYVESLQAEPDEPAQPQYGENNLPSPLLLQLRQAREMGDEQTELALQAYIATQVAEQKINEKLAAFEKQNAQAPSRVENEFYAMQAEGLARDQYDRQYGQGEWDEIKRDAAEWLHDNAPDLMPDSLTPSQAAARLVWAAEYVQGRKMLTATEQERTQQAEARHQRLMAQGLRGSGATPTTQETAEEAWDKIMNSPSGSYASLRRSQ